MSDSDTSKDAAAACRSHPSLSPDSHERTSPAGLNTGPRDRDGTAAQPQGTEQSKPSEDHPERARGADTQVIFDERFALFMDQFGGLCDREMVPVAVAVVCDPKISQGPLVMTRGHTYDVARVLAQLLRRLKADIGRELDA